MRVNTMESKPFLKIGNYTINPAAIVCIDWDYHYTDEQTICIYLQSQVEQNTICFAKESPEGKVLRKYFDSTMQHVDLIAIFGEPE